MSDRCERCGEVPNPDGQCACPSRMSESSFAAPHGSVAHIVKGDKHGECNRTACRNQDATWFNKSTRKYYCQPCARKIMSWAENVGLLEKEVPPNDKLRDGATERRPSSQET